MKAVTADEMRDIDRMTIEDYGIPGAVLMENAGRGAADAIEEYISGSAVNKILVIAGKGNNGGDGLVVARHLVNRGIDCEVVLACKKSSIRGDARCNLDSALKMGISIYEADGDIPIIKQAIERSDLIVDALFGTGLDKEVRGFFKEVIETINSAAQPVISLDIPSGIESTKGQLLGAAVRAEMTVMFCLPKIGAVIYPGADYAGELVLVDTGAPHQLLEDNRFKTSLILDEDVEDILASRGPDTHKGTYGHLLIVAGSTGKTGAAVMTAQGAMRSGAGLVTVAAPAGVNDILETKLTEVMTVPLPDKGTGILNIDAAGNILRLFKDKSTLIIGPGISREPGVGEAVKEVLERSTIPAIIDADALWHIAGFKDILKNSRGPVILTPHPGEMAVLLGTVSKDIQKDRIGISREFAKDHGCIVILKGARSIIATPEGNTFINTTGNPGMASGGTGDVLCGMLGAFLCQGYSPLDSCIAAVFLHGKAGDTAAEEKGEAGLIAGDIIEKIPETMRKILAA